MNLIHVIPIKVFFEDKLPIFYNNYTMYVLEFFIKDIVVTGSWLILA